MDSSEIQNNKFTGFIKPVLDLIDNGIIYRKGFWWLYLVSAIVNLLSPFILLAWTIGTGIFSLSFGIGFCILLVWIAYTFSCWLGFQVFWNRMKKIDALFSEDEDFVAMPLFADYIKTLGEYCCIVSIGTMPCFVLLGIIAAVNDDIRYIIPITNIGIALVFVAIFVGILGYVTMLAAKFCAESITAFASIANNTKNIAKIDNHKLRSSLDEK